MICLDASLVLSWLLPEDLSASAFKLRSVWDAAHEQLVAPPLLRLEVPSSLRLATYRGRVTNDESDEALAAFLDMEIRIVEPRRLLAETWELGETLNAPRLYDFFYVALARNQGCELWTADQRLVNFVAAHCPWVKWVGSV
jgi:predicted nucleic acid-binding protein